MNQENEVSHSWDFHIPEKAHQRGSRGLRVKIAASFPKRITFALAFDHREVRTKLVDREMRTCDLCRRSQSEELSIVWGWRIFREDCSRKLAPNPIHRNFSSQSSNFLTLLGRNRWSGSQNSTVNLGDMALPMTRTECQWRIWRCLEEFSERLCGSLRTYGA